MAASLDLNFLPLVRQNGRDLPEIPGLYAVTPPRHAARGRDSDILALYLTLTGSEPFSPQQYTELLVLLAQTYYRTSGTVTAALRTVADTANSFLLDRNRKHQGTGQQSIGLFSQMVMRGEMLYLAQSGPVHAYLITTEGTQWMYEPEASGRGIGLGRTVAVRFYNLSLHPNEYLLVAHQPAPGWDADQIHLSAGQNLESLRRRLLGLAGLDLGAVLVQAIGGTGRLHYLRLKTTLQDMAHPSQPAVPTTTEAPASAEGQRTEPPGASAPAPAAPQAAPATAEAARPEVETATETEEIKKEAEPEPQAPAGAVQKQAEATVAPAQPAPQVQAGPVEPSPAPAEAAMKPPTDVQPPPKAQISRASQVAARRAARQAARNRPSPFKFLGKVGGAFMAALAAFGRAVGGAFAQVGRALQGVLKRILPDETLLHLSPSAMIFIALAIPITLSAVAGVVYIQRGQLSQYQTNYQAALEAAGLAAQEQDPAKARVAWGSVLADLDKAEQLRITTDAEKLRKQARDALDSLDSIQRLDFEAAISGGLDKNIHITRMVATSSEIYLLNRNQGNVIRAVLTGSGYDVDPQFNCGPIPGPIVVGPLIDIAGVPAGDPSHATILGMDANGTLVYCIPGDQPLVSVLAPPPTNFNSPRALTLSSGDLYVLDPPTNGVWIYRNLDSSKQPRLFFGDEVPPMQDVVDISVNGDDLYLLHSDGHLTLCTYSGIQGAPTRCQDPFNYTDTRPGRQSGAIISDSLFEQLYFSPPPDPSMYMLDPKNQAVFHFSLRMTLQAQYRPIQNLTSTPASAFAVSPTRIIFIAIANQVYNAALP